MRLLDRRRVGGRRNRASATARRAPRGSHQASHQSGHRPRAHARYRLPGPAQVSDRRYGDCCTACRRTDAFSIRSVPGSSGRAARRGPACAARESRLVRHRAGCGAAGPATTLRVLVGCIDTFITDQVQAVLVPAVNQQIADGNAKAVLQTKCSWKRRPIRKTRRLQDGDRLGPGARD